MHGSELVTSLNTLVVSPGGRAAAHAGNPAGQAVALGASGRLLKGLTGLVLETQGLNGHGRASWW